MGRWSARITDNIHLFYDELVPATYHSRAVRIVMDQPVFALV